MRNEVRCHAPDRRQYQLLVHKAVLTNKVLTTLVRDGSTHLEDRARVDIAATILYPFRKAGIPPPDEHIHRNRDVVQSLTSAKQPPVHEEELVLALTVRTAGEERFVVSTEAGQGNRNTTRMVVQSQQRTCGENGSHGLHFLDKARLHVHRCSVSTLI